MNINPDRIEQIRKFAEKGDQRAIEMIGNLSRMESEIDQFFTSKESEISSQINEHVQNIAHLLTRSDAISSRDPEIPTRIIDIANTWGKILDPKFGSNPTQIVNG